jgi:hypothetical protein
MIDTAQLALPKPGHLVGRLVLSSYGYAKLKRQRWIEQGRCCARCPIYLTSPAEGHLHHPNGRGLGGGKRDDRATELLCIGCHLEEHKP